MRKEFKIGLFALIVIVVSFFVLNYLRGEDIFNKESEYVSTYSDLEGLVASAPVFVKGYKAGKVTEVSYDSNSGLFSVTCSVSKDFVIPEDSKMTIYSVDIMGGKGVKIDLGESDVPAQDGDTLAPCFETGLMDGLSSRIVPLMDAVENTLDSLGVTVSGVNRILSESNASKVGSILAHVEKLVDNLEDVSAMVDGKSSEISGLIDDLKSFSAGLAGTLKNVDAAVAGVGTAVDSLNSADLAGTLTSVKELIDNINDPEGSIGKLFVDDSVYNSIDSLLINIGRFVDKIQENPKKYLKISVF